MSCSVLPLPIVMTFSVVELVRAWNAPAKVALAFDKSKVPVFVPPAADPKLRLPDKDGFVVVKRSVPSSIIVAPV